MEQGKMIILFGSALVVADTLIMHPTVTDG